MGLGNFRLAKELMDGKVHEAHAANMGCTLIPTKILREIPFKRALNYGTEDLAWFAEAIEKGYTLKVDTSLTLFHLDANGYVYCWWNLPIKEKGYKYYLKPTKEKIKEGVL